MNRSGSEVMDAFAINGGEFSQIADHVNSGPQTQKQHQERHPPIAHQNIMAQWAQTNQPVPPLNFLAQPSQLNQFPWPNTLPQVQNAMLQMAPFGMPLISQQIIQEAVAMSTPVDATDEPILLTALLNAKKTGRNFKEALNGLHGNKGHSSSLWKDYYLEHKDRIDDWIDMCIQKENHITLPGLKQATKQVPVATVKKPSPASFKRERSPSWSPNPSKTASFRKKRSMTTAHVPNIEGRKRSTMNSLSAPEPVFGGRLPAPNASIRIPVPPSRSPTPPSHRVARGRGFLFTQEDREFFIKFIGWQLKQKPLLNRQELCDLLAEKASHHSSASWYAFWSNNHDLPDKILAAARGELDGSNEFTNDEEDPVHKRKPHYKEDTTTEDDNGEYQEDSEESDGEASDTGPVRQYSEADMGETGGTFNKADMYITAKYIASTPDWERLRNKDRWDPFHEKHPQRSAKSWTELYRRYEKDLLKLAKRIRLENKRSSILSQCARPSKALPGAKRKVDEESEELQHKRSRREESD